MRLMQQHEPDGVLMRLLRGCTRMHACMHAGSGTTKPRACANAAWLLSSVPAHIVMDASQAQTPGSSSGSIAPMLPSPAYLAYAQDGGRTSPGPGTTTPAADPRNAIKAAAIGKAQAHWQGQSPVGDAVPAGARSPRTPLVRRTSDIVTAREAQQLSGPCLSHVLATALEIAQAVTHMHAAGIVHGDLTPCE